MTPFPRFSTLLVFATLSLAATASATTYRAVAARNGLEKQYPTRGFGDSNAVDVWVPFVVHTQGAAWAGKATLVMEVKPISQLIGTDSLLLRGKSGKVHSMYTGFSDLKPKQFHRVTVDLSGNADVMAAVRAGRLDGVIQDDTAVRGVGLYVTTGGGAAPVEQPTAVYVWDVYYWGMDPSWGTSSWYRYQSYWSEADAKRAQTWLGTKGYYTSVKRRFWRNGRG